MRKGFELSPTLSLLTGIFIGLLALWFIIGVLKPYYAGSPLPVG